jgi:hypothetical protein
MTLHQEEHSGKNSSWVAAMIINPEESEIVAIAIAEDPLLATSKFPLIEPNKGGVQRNRKDFSFQAKICLSIKDKI